MQRRDLLVGAGACAAIAAMPLRATDLALPQPAALGIIAAREWAARTEITLYDIEIAQAVHYSEAAMALGVARLSHHVPDFQLMNLVAQRWAKARDYFNSANHVDSNVIGVWPMLLGDADGTGIALADGQWDETRADGLTAQARFWIDDVWMIGALQTQAWRHTGDPKYLDRAALMARIYANRLQRPNGLFFHGPDAPFHWGRGNGWIAAGMAEVISVLPEDHHEYVELLAAYRRMMEALLQYQAEDGMWRQLVDKPEAWKETSGTAMFGFAMQRGLNAGLLDPSIYEAPARRAWDALSTYVDGEGRLREVCVGTGQSLDMQFYLDRPRVTGDLHGQAPLLWFAAEMLA